MKIYYSKYIKIRDERTKNEEEECERKKKQRKNKR